MDNHISLHPNSFLHQSEFFSGWCIFIFGTQNNVAMGSIFGFFSQSSATIKAS